MKNTVIASLICCFTAVSGCGSQSSPGGGLIETSPQGVAVTSASAAAATTGGNANTTSTTGNGNTTIAANLNLPTSPMMLRNLNSNFVIDIWSGVNADGARIQQWDAWGGTMQQWVFQTQSDGSVLIVNPTANKLLEVYAASTAVDGIIDLWSATAGTNQAWVPARGTAAGAYTFTNVYSKLCMAVLNGNTTAGASIAQEACNQSPEQQWLFTTP